ncbi:toxic anion resistance protein [Photobacterium sp. R1]
MSHLVEPVKQTTEQLQENGPAELTPDIVALAERFDPFDSVATITFGKEALEKITAFSDHVLEQIRVRDTGDAGEILQSMVESMDSAAFDQLKGNSFLANLPLIGELFDSFKKFSRSFDSVKQQLEQLSQQLEAQEVKLAHDISQLDGLYDNNLDLLKGLEQYIAAGQYKLDQLKTDVLPELLTASEQSGDALEAQKYRDASQAVARLEKRVHNLALTRMAAVQTAPQIRLSQEGNKMLMEDIQDIVHNTFPLWKRQFLIAISNYEKEKALKVTRAVKDYTNKQYVKNAEGLKILEEQIAENYQRGILDLESLQAVNQLTIETLNNTLSRVKEGRQQREQAEKVIAKAEQELKLALQQTLEN